MDTKIIFLTKVQFMNHHIQDMYVNAISEEFSIELWDLSKIYNVKEDTNLNDVKVIKSLSQLDDELKVINQSYNIVAVTNIQLRDLDTIYTTLKSNNVVIVGLLKDTICVSLEERGHNKYVHYYDLKNKVLTYMPFLRKLVKRNRGGAYKYDYLMAGVNYYPKQTNKFLRIHQIKYDESLIAKDTENIVGEKYILYLGSAPTTHPMYGGGNSLNHKEYMKSICAHLDRIEKNTGLRVVISGHPKGKYKKEEWNGREIFIGNTASLIHHCEGVICHWSTSLINVVLEHKPLQIIFTPEMLTSSFRYTMVTGLAFADECGADICNLSNPHDWKMEVNNDSYDRFLYSEIIYKDFQQRSNASLICEHLHSIVKEIS